MRARAWLVRAVGAALSPVLSRLGTWFPIVREPFTGAWQRNIEWTLDNVLQHPTVYACVTRISQDVGKLLPTIRENDGANDVWRKIRNAAHSPVLDTPNHYQTWQQFVDNWLVSKLVWGNVYVLLEEDERETVRAMYILDPARVTVLVAPDGDVFYSVKRDDLAGVNEEEIPIPSRFIQHDRAPCLFHPLVGTPPIWAAGLQAHVGLTIHRNQAGFFANGSNPSGILSTPVHVNKEKSQELSALWNARYSGEGSGGVAVLGDDMKFMPMRMSSVDAQQIETDKKIDEDICKAFHVPPFKVGVGPTPNVGNIEALNQIYYSDCLQAHIEGIESGLDQAFGFKKKAFPGGVRRRVELDLVGLLRMDTKTQVETITLGVKGTLFTPNEGREFFDLEPQEGGDVLYKQQQDFSLAALAERDRNKPFEKPAPPAPPTPNNEPPAEPAEDNEEEAERSAQEFVRFFRQAAADEPARYPKDKAA